MWDARTNQAVKVYMLFRTKESKAEVWDFEGKADNSQAN